MKQIANIKDIRTIIVNVSEKIEDKYLQDFTYNSLNLQKINHDKNDFIFTNYLPYSNNYQIIIINKKYKYILPQILEMYYINKKNINSFDLFILDDFFVLYKDMKMYYFQKLDYKISDVEIKEYIVKKLKINIENIFEIQKETLQQYQIDFNKKAKEELINIKDIKNNSFKIYLLSILLLSSLTFSYFAFFIDNNSKEEILNNHNEKVKNEIEKFIQNNKYKPLLQDFLLIMKELKNYKLNLESFEYKLNKVQLTASALKKDDIYLFIELYKNKLLSNKVQYIENESKYKVVIDVQLSK
ncbi:MAG: hypothetical protein ACERKK_09900 [Poseidonibacter sp.]|uniref:hypothetical protein n=1 Tax=Poseidonibacter sp. TaxID=2321188 RepID=UPI00359E69D8